MNRNKEVSHILQTGPELQTLQLLFLLSQKKKRPQITILANIRLI